MTAIRAIFHGYKPIPTRKAFQLIMEVPEEHTAQVFETLGIPNSSTDIWVGIARLIIPETIDPVHATAEKLTEEENAKES